MSIKTFMATAVAVLTVASAPSAATPSVDAPETTEVVTEEAADAIAVTIAVKDAVRTLYTAPKADSK